MVDWILKSCTIEGQFPLEHALIHLDQFHPMEEWEAIQGPEDLVGKGQSYDNQLIFNFNIYSITTPVMQFLFFFRPEPDSLRPPGFEDDMFM